MQTCGTQGRLATPGTTRRRLFGMSEVAMAIEEPLPESPARAAAQLSTDQQQLRRLLRRQLDRHLDHVGFQPALTVMGVCGDQSEVLRLGIDRPENAVLGFVLPSNYAAVAVIAASVVATPPRRRHEDAALALGVGRSGAVISLLITDSRQVIDTRAPHGWLIDACQRSVALRTAPCDTAPLVLPVALWLDRLMVSILGSPGRQPLPWSSAVELCPIPRRWRCSDPVDLGTTLGSTTRSWAAMRRAAARGTQSLVGVDPALARWMDDPMFARWCLGSFPDVSSLRADVEFLAPPTVAENIEIALRAAQSAFAD